jgi:transposase-like protein
MAALLAGQGVNEIAAQYHISKATISRWKKAARATAGRSEDVGALLLDYLRENLTTLRAQAVAFRDATWLRVQDAADVGVLHGILTDKAVRLLEAMEPSARPE